MVAKVWLLPFPLSPVTETWRPLVFRTDREASDMIMHSATTSSPSWSRAKVRSIDCFGLP
jgi:hypothetical protein